MNGTTSFRKKTQSEDDQSKLESQDINIQTDGDPQESRNRIIKILQNFNVDNNNQMRKSIKLLENETQFKFIESAALKVQEGPQIAPIIEPLGPTLVLHSNHSENLQEQLNEGLITLGRDQVNALQQRELHIQLTGGYLIQEPASIGLEMNLTQKISHRMQLSGRQGELAAYTQEITKGNYEQRQDEMQPNSSGRLLVDIRFAEMRICRVQVSEELCVEEYKEGREGGAQIVVEESESQGLQEIIYQGEDDIKRFITTNKSLLCIYLIKNGGSIALIPLNQHSIESFIDLLRPFVCQRGVQSDYNFVKSIGKGAFGEVHMAHRQEKFQSSKGQQYQGNREILQLDNKKATTGEKERFAIKVLSIEKILESKKHIISLKNEISIMWDMIRCSAALQLLEIYVDSLNVYLVLEFQEKGSLLSQILSMPNKENEDGSQSKYQRPLNENQVKMIMTQILLALDYMHNMRIAHRDIKLDNVLINKIEDNEFKVKIADFGLAIKQETKMDTETGAYLPSMQGLCGTPGFIAPEIFNEQSHYDEKCDIFSIGSVLFKMLTGRYLFEIYKSDQLFQANKNCKTLGSLRYLEALDTVSSEAKDLIGQLIQADPGNRPTAREALQHPWFRIDRQIIKDLLSANDQLVSRPDSIRQHQHNYFANRTQNSGLLLMSQDMVHSYKLARDSMLPGQSPVNNQHHTSYMADGTPSPAERHALVIPAQNNKQSSQILCTDNTIVDSSHNQNAQGNVLNKQFQNKFNFLLKQQNESFKLGENIIHKTQEDELQMRKKQFKNVKENRVSHSSQNLIKNSEFLKLLQKHQRDQLFITNNASSQIQGQITSQPNNGNFSKLGSPQNANPDHKIFNKTPSPLPLIPNLDSQGQGSLKSPHNFNPYNHFPVPANAGNQGYTGPLHYLINKRGNKGDPQSSTVPTFNKFFRQDSANQNTQQLSNKFAFQNQISSQIGQNFPQTQQNHIPFVQNPTPPRKVNYFEAIQDARSNSAFDSDENSNVPQSALNRSIRGQSQATPNRGFSQPHNSFKVGIAHDKGSLKNEYRPTLFSRNRGQSQISGINNHDYFAKKSRDQDSMHQLFNNLAQESGRGGIRNTANFKRYLNGRTDNSQLEEEEEEEVEIGSFIQHDDASEGVVSEDDAIAKRILFKRPTRRIKRRIINQKAVQPPQNQPETEMTEVQWTREIHSKVLISEVLDALQKFEQSEEFKRMAFQDASTPQPAPPISRKQCFREKMRDKEEIKAGELRKKQDLAQLLIENLPLKMNTNLQNNRKLIQDQVTQQIMNNTENQKIIGLALNNQNILNKKKETAQELQIVNLLRIPEKREDSQEVSSTKAQRGGAAQLNVKALKRQKPPRRQGPFLSDMMKQRIQQIKGNNIMIQTINMCSGLPEPPSSPKDEDYSKSMGMFQSRKERNITDPPRQDYWNISDDSIDEGVGDFPMKHLVQGVFEVHSNVIKR